MKKAMISLAVAMFGVFILFIGLTVFTNTSTIGGVLLFVLGLVILLVSMLIEDRNQW